MNRANKLFFVFSLLALLLLTFTRSANAFDGRSAENITIRADEVINDDLYVTAGTFVLDDRGEEKLLARNYSTNPLIFPEPLNDETQQEFSVRLRKDMVSYVATHPREVLYFVSNHFFHNLVNSALYIAPHYSSVSPEGLINRVPFWGTWNGRLNRPEVFALVVNLSIIAWGIAIAQQKNKSAGWFPLIVFIFSSFIVLEINSILFESCGRSFADSGF